VAYNNGYPVTYPQMYYPQYQPAPQQPVAQQSTGIIWVQGEAGAKSYLVAPNTTVQLWDSERQSIYLKSADASGMPSIKIIDYTIRDQMPANAPVSAPTNAPAYATKADLDTLADKIATLRADFDSMSKGAKE